MKITKEIIEEFKEKLAFIEMEMEHIITNYPKSEFRTKHGECFDEAHDDIENAVSILTECLR